MSARGAGSWAQFRAAVEELRLSDEGETTNDSDSEDIADEAGLPLYHVLRLNLQRLGHAEFGAGAAEEDDWKVTPPCLAVTAQPFGWRAVLAGARSRDLLARVVSQRESAGIEQLPVSACPDVVRLDSKNSDTLTNLAAGAGVRLQPDAATAILMGLPPIDDRTILKAVPIPSGTDWKVERFSVEGLSWRRAMLEDARTCAAGLFRFTIHHRR